MIVVLNRSATIAKIRGDSGHPCLVPEWMGKVLSERSPFTITCAWASFLALIKSMISCTLTMFSLPSRPGMNPR